LKAKKETISDFDGVANALIIKDIPSTLINNIQAIVHYNRDQFAYTQDNAIGLIYELYNETNDPDLIRPLATTNEISVSAPVYRFDFPSITDYTGFATGDSTTNIIREEDATTETANYVLTTFEVKGNASITGDLVVGTTNIITELGTKQATITSATDLTSNSLVLSVALRRNVAKRRIYERNISMPPLFTSNNSLKSIDRIIYI